MYFKNIILSFLLFFIFTNFSFASDLNISCFKDSTSIEVSDITTKKVKINSNFGDVFFLQENNLVPYKTFEEGKKISIPFKIISVSSGDSAMRKFINDGNNSTLYTFDSLNDKNKTITLDFGSNLIPKTFESYFNINHNGPIIYSISQDNSKYSQVNEYNIRDFNFRYLKISFLNNKEDSTISATDIREISFLKSSFSTILINPLKIGKINIYRNYDCNFDSIKDIYSKYFILNQKTKFSLDSKTKEFSIDFLANSSYNKDFDKDSIINDIDNCKYIFNPDQIDTDGDLVGDKCDFDNASKNPLDSDIDKDGIGDSLDNCKYIYNPNQLDSNGDGMGDICSDDDFDGIIGNRDNCPNIANPDQKDINANNIGDACEFDKDKDEIFDSVDNCINLSNPDQGDIDNDRIGDACDNCKLYNPEQKDEDKNGIGDTCDEREEYEKTHDSDFDGKLDFEDNCQKISNPGQEDLDNDGIGNACDNCLSIQNPDQSDEDKNSVGDICEDIDKDGVDGFKDNCPNIANPDQNDVNNDGVGDVCGDDDNDGILNSSDNCPNIANPDQNDVDGDKKGDNCDNKDDRYIESNKSFFIGLMVIVVVIFGVAIFAMIKKLRN